MIAFLSAPSSRELTWYLLVLALALPMSVIAKSEQPKTVKWDGIETFENAYTYSGRISAHLGNVNEYNHKIIVRFTYVEETDAQGARKFTSRKISWTAQGKAVATKFTSTTCNGSGALELVGLSDGELNEKLKIPCITNDKGILAASFTKPPDRIRPPELVGWEKVRNNKVLNSCAYSVENIRPSGQRYTYTVRVTPCNCDLTPLTQADITASAGFIFISTHPHQAQGRQRPDRCSEKVGMIPNGARLVYRRVVLNKDTGMPDWYLVEPPGATPVWIPAGDTSSTRPVTPIQRGPDPQLPPSAPMEGDIRSPGGSAARG